MGLDIVELVMEIENEFELHFKDSESNAVLTVGDLYHFVLRGLPPGDAAHDRKVWDKVRQIVAKQLGVREAELHMTTRFVEDLNAD
ncbi:MAG TPA: hypothetical protein VGN88_09465 [Phycisphaerae bacterium]